MPRERRGPVNRIVVRRSRANGVQLVPTWRWKLRSTRGSHILVRNVWRARMLGLGASRFTIVLTQYSIVVNLGGVRVWVVKALSTTMSFMCGFLILQQNLQCHQWQTRLGRPQDDRSGRQLYDAT
eukprot:1742040-Pleurochrysis_carterae.AAC.2